MRNLFLTFASVLLLSSLASASNDCAGKSVNCTDDCTGQIRPYDDADTCKTAWNTGAGCQTSFGFCQADEFEPCVAKSVSCYDQCSGEYKFFTNLDTCGNRPGPDGTCQQAYAYCRGP